MANNFNIDITASDKATRVFNQLKGNVGGLNRNLATVNETAHRGAEIFRSMVPSIAALTGIGSIAGISAMVNSFGNGSIQLKNMADNIGLSTTKLQELHGAGKLAGLSISSVDSGMGSLGTTMENAKWRDPQLAQTFAAIGVQLHQTKSGAMDTHQALLDISDVMTHKLKGKPQAQEALASRLGISGLLPLLRQGSAGIQELEQRAKGLGYVQTPDMLENGKKLYESFTKAELAAEGLKNTIANQLAPGFTIFADDATKGILKVEKVVEGLNEDFQTLFGWLDKYSKLATGNKDETFFGMVGATADEIKKNVSPQVGAKGKEPWMLPAYIDAKKKADAVNAPRTPDVISPKERAAFSVLMNTESGNRQVDQHGNPIVGRDKNGRASGAIGIAQVMPSTARMVARQNGIKWDENKYKTDAAYNAQLGRLYFHQLLGTYSGDYAKAYAAYNAGPGRLNEGIQEARKHGNVNDWIRYMPSETQAYVPKNMAALSRTGAAPHKVQVEVTLNNAPAGTSARIASGGELASVNTNNSLPGVNSP